MSRNQFISVLEQAKIASKNQFGQVVIDIFSFSCMHIVNLFINVNIYKHYTPEGGTIYIFIWK